MKKILFMLQTVIFSSIWVAPVFGAKKGVSSVTSGINTLTNVVLAIVGGVGVIFLAWGLVDFGTAVASHETSQQMQGVKKAVAGLVIIAIPTLITILK